MGDAGDAGSRDRVITEAEFGARLRQAPPQTGLFAVLAGMPAKADEISRKHFWVLQEAAHELETYLDNYGARDNQTFVLYAELNASLRNLAVSAHTLGHVLLRYPTYGVELPGTLPTGESSLVAFTTELAACTRYLGRAMLALIAEQKKEAERLGAAPATGSGSRLHDAEVKEFRLHLPNDLRQAKRADDDGAITVLLNDFLEIVREARRVRAKVPPRGASLREFMEQELTEAVARKYQSNVHSLQSSYDTHVKPTQHHELRELKRLRGHISLAYHLLEVVNGLVHFYERHEGEKTATQLAIGRIVPPDELLDHVVHFALRWAAEALVAVEPMVRQLMPRFMTQHVVELALPDGIHLHARPLNLIVRVVRRHGKPVEIVVDAEASSANSLMGLILFVGRHPQRRSYVFRGDKEPLDDLQRLFACGLGEHGLEQLPVALAYLRER